MAEQLFIVFNKTDGFTASGHKYTSEEADQFIKDFPLRYKAQGYYRTSNMEKIDPKDVILEKIPLNPTGEVDEEGEPVFAWDFPE